MALGHLHLRTRDKYIYFSGTWKEKSTRKSRRVGEQIHILKKAENLGKEILSIIVILLPEFASILQNMQVNILIFF